MKWVVLKAFWFSVEAIGVGGDRQCCKSLYEHCMALTLRHIPVHDEN